MTLANYRGFLILLVSAFSFLYFDANESVAVLRALTTAATGLEAQQANINRISNDIANVNTDGYKRTRTELSELGYETVKEAGGSTGPNSQTPVGIQVGLGVKVGTTHKIFKQGITKMTYHPYDLMIEGRGFFPVQTANGEIAYTRNGAFHLDTQGRLSLSSGAQLVPTIVIPPTSMSVSVTATGEVRVAQPNLQEATIGQIQLVTFQNEQGLTAVGEGLYRPSLASGPPLQGIPSENGLGVIQQGALEGSNVDIANSMVEMIQAQRAYEMNTKVMGVADQMLNATANIRQ